MTLISDANFERINFPAPYSFQMTSAGWSLHLEDSALAHSLTIDNAVDGAPGIALGRAADDLNDSWVRLLTRVNKKALSTSETLAVTIGFNALAGTQPIQWVGIVSTSDGVSYEVVSSANGIESTDADWTLFYEELSVPTIDRSKTYYFAISFDSGRLPAKLRDIQVIGRSAVEETQPVFEVSATENPLTDDGPKNPAEVDADIEDDETSKVSASVPTNFDHDLGVVEHATWKDFRLSLSGWVKNPNLPGFPVKVSLCLDGKPVLTTLARELSHDEGRDAAYKFKLDYVTGCRGLQERVSITVGDLATRLLVPDVSIVQDSNKSSNPLPSTSSAPPVNSSDTVIGSFDSLDYSFSKGWAFSKQTPLANLDLILLLNGIPFSHTRPRTKRNDVAKKYGTHGFHGFSFELVPNIGWVDDNKLEVITSIGANLLSNPKRVLAKQLKNPVTATKEILPKYFIRPKESGLGIKQVSVIILNRNGAPLLARLFSSAVNLESSFDHEWIVIDHDSVDSSRDISLKYAAEGLNIKFVNRGGNYSFSDSNNYGASISSGDILVFMNNDIILTQTILNSLARALDDTSVGLVGVRLHDAVVGPVWEQASPIQHLGVFIGPSLVNGGFRPFEARLVNETAVISQSAVFVPAATGALFAVRKSDFFQVGGFDVDYFYGYEDVDLCFKLSFDLGLGIVSLNDVKALHMRGFTRNDGSHKDPRRDQNATIFNRKWGSKLRRECRDKILSFPGYLSGHRPIIGFAVTEVSDTTNAGDYFTALELAKALQELYPVHIELIGQPDWYDLGGVDIIISMVDAFDPTKIERARPHLRTVAWARNWFDRWCERPGIHAFDHVWASSTIASEYMQNQLNRSVDVVRIATSTTNFSEGKYVDELSSDYCFTGSRFGLPREVEMYLDPKKINGVGAVFGHGWSNSEGLADILRGPLGYSQIPNVYASTSIVIDDANIATKEWGSCNSRVFDALGAGRLVITNGELGAKELFGDLLPTWRNGKQLTTQLNKWLSNDKARNERVSLLQALVESEHTYQKRAAQVGSILSRKLNHFKISIKSGSPGGTAGQNWGDRYFAESLATSLRKLGHVVRVDSRENWYCALASTDDIVICLRGIIEYKPAPHQLNMMWLISHPEDVSIHEMKNYDALFVASNKYAATLKELVDVPVFPLLQCFDAGIFSNVETGGFEPVDVVFVGNSRNVYRESVKACVEAGIDISVYGSGWESFISPNYIKGEFVPNDYLPAIYKSCKWVLCDHWDDMRKYGFLSNRIYDVLACGGNVLTDRVDGIDEYFLDLITTYDNPDEIPAILARGPLTDAVKEKAAAKFRADNHSFDGRAEALMMFASSYFI